MATGFTRSDSGVRIADEFRSNLIIDRYDPVLLRLPARKTKHMRSENSEDVITWNVFRSLRQIDPSSWLPHLGEGLLASEDMKDQRHVSIQLWMPVRPPLGLVIENDEGESEIDVVIESPTWVWFIEAKYRSDISERTSTRADRDQILRNIDVGSYYAGARRFFFSLLLTDPASSPRGAAKLQEYSDLSVPRERLRDHRPDGLANLQNVGLLTWSRIGSALEEAARSPSKADEAIYAQRALDWMSSKRLLLGSA